MATYSAEVSAIGLSVGLPPQQLSTYKSAEVGALALTPALNSATLLHRKAAIVSSLALSAGLQTVTLRKKGGIATVSRLALTLGLPQQTLRILALESYPEIQAPSQITFTPPKFPLTKSRTQQGTTTTRVWAATPGDAALSFEYEVIDDASAELVLQSWDSARGILFPVDIPASAFGGASAGLLNAFSLTNQRLQWYFTQRPQLRSLFGGYSSLSVSFRGAAERVAQVNIETASSGSLSLALGLKSVNLMPLVIADVQPLALSVALPQVSMRISNGIASVQPLALSLGLRTVDLTLTGSTQEALFLPSVFLESVFIS